MNSEIPVSYRTFFLLIVAAIVLAALGMLLFYPSLDRLDIVNINEFPLGRWQSISPVFSYYPENVINIVEDEGGQRIIQATFNDTQNYAGLGLIFNQSISEDAVLVLDIQSSERLDTLQIDITDGSLYGSNIEKGEIFSYITPIDKGVWETYSIPIEDFNRNEYQGANNPSDGVLDVNPIRSVEFVFAPGTTTQFSIGNAFFIWKNSKWLKVSFLFICAVLGFFLLRFPPGNDTFSGDCFFSESVASSLIYIVSGLSFVFLLLIERREWLLFNNNIYFGLVLVFLAFDGIVRGRGVVRSVLWPFRYLSVFLVGNFLKIDLPPLAYFLFFLSASIPIVQRRSKLFMFAIPVVGVLGLCLNFRISNIQAFLMYGLLIAAAGFLLFFARSLLNHYTMSVSMGKLTFLYEDLFNNTADAIFMVNENREIQNVNDGFEKLIGESRDRIVNKKLEDFVYPDDRSDIPTIADFEKKSNVKYQLRFVNQAGQVRFASINECMIKRGSEPAGFQAIAHDITLLKEYENSIRRAKETAENANRSKSQFLANMSHELRTPLNSIIGFAALLRKDPKECFGSKERTFLEKVHGNALFLLTLIDRILDLSKIDAEKMEIVLEPISLDSIIHDVVSHFQVQTDEKEIAWHVDCPSFDRTLETDVGKLRQILNNLIGNAVKFTDRGGITIRVSERDRTTILFQIIDTGIGIAGDKQSVIFESFTQADGSASRKYTGTGLGLSISKKSVELMGGEIGVNSELGKGSEFWFVLPMEKRTVSERH